MNALKSISIADDLSRQGVVEGYRATRKSLHIVRAVCGLEGSRATHVVAPYGAGKSIAALVGITLLAGDAAQKDHLVARIAKVDSQFARGLSALAGNSLVLLLHGACPDVAKALCGAAGLPLQNTMEDALSVVLAKAKQDGADRLAIVWDEFGQHLETLARQGRSEDLLAVQTIAEWAVRRSMPTVTVTTLMHRGIYHYARRVSDGAQAAWRKIEGRFDTLSLIDDGIDAYDMIADVLRGQRGGDCVNLARRARAVGFFPSFGDEAALSRVLAQTAPLTPAALDVVPRLAAQIAQNERTLFRCLEETVALADQGSAVGLETLYDYFEPAMRADVGPGGTHRRLVEAETALSRTETALQRMIVKSAALLQLGLATERVKLPMERLLFAVTEGTGVARTDAEAAIMALLDRKVLFHRQRIDDVSIWHGADIDLAGLVAEEAVRVSVEQDIIATLHHLFPPDAYTAPEYNYIRFITRFAHARFVLANDLLDEARRQSLLAEADLEDALVALVVDATADDIAVLAVAEMLPPHVIIALPRRSADIAPILADLMAVEKLLDTPDLLAMDPLVSPELNELRAESDTALRQALDGVMNPDRGEVIWLSGGNAYDFTGHISPGSILTEIFAARFPETPRIRNEQVVRRTVTPVTRSARKRCSLAVIERTGLPALGYQGATSADASIYRTVFEKTGLYRPDGTRWGWAPPSEVQDPGLRRVWGILEDFFTLTTDEPKNVKPLFDRLTAPPIGLREGLLPLFVAAGLQAFARCTALREETGGQHRYVDDINPTVIERICEAPARFTLDVAAFTSDQMQTLESLIRQVARDRDAHEPDLVRAFYDAILDWKTALPSASLTASNLGEAASIMQPWLRRRAFDPLTFLSRDLPNALGEAPLSSRTTQVFADAITEMEAVADAFAAKATTVAADLFNARISGETLPVLQAAAAWAEALPFDEKATGTLDQEARGLIKRARGAMTVPHGERGFVTTLSGILFGIGFNGWNDGTALSFHDRLEAALLRIEDLALEKSVGSASFEPFVKNRLASIFDEYGAKIGRDLLIKYLQDIYQEGS